MRLNKYIASSTSLSRRSADEAIVQNRVMVNGSLPIPGQQISDTDQVKLDDQVIKPMETTRTILLHKPVGYVCSHDGQGSKTVYDLLPAEYQHLQTIGRLDKDSSGLLLLTSDGDLHQQLAHPRYQKTKVYQILLNKPLQPLHRQLVADQGIQLEDGLSKLQIDRISDTDDINWHITMHEGRNRQIRRSFESLGYTVIKLHRLQFGNYNLGALEAGEYRSIDNDKGISVV